MEVVPVLGVETLCWECWPPSTVELSTMPVITSSVVTVPRSHSTYAAVQPASGVVALSVSAGHVAAKLNHERIEPWPETGVSRPAAGHHVAHLGRGKPGDVRVMAINGVKTTSPGRI